MLKKEYNSDNLKHQYLYVRDVTINSKVHCMLYVAIFYTGYGGICDMVNHMRFEKHKEAITAKATSQKLSSLFEKTEF